jgi:hypothetical protein
MPIKVLMVPSRGRVVNVKVRRPKWRQYVMY